MTFEYSVARQFSVTPGSRYESEGPYSGEQLREVLEPQVWRAVCEGSPLTVDLDGTVGYGVAFLDEAFGGLARRGYNVSLLKECLRFKSEEEPYLVEDIWGCIEAAGNERE